MQLNKHGVSQSVFQQLFEQGDFLISVSRCLVRNLQTSSASMSCLSKVVLNLSNSYSTAEP